MSDPRLDVRITTSSRTDLAETQQLVREAWERAKSREADAAHPRRVTEIEPPPRERLADMLSSRTWARSSPIRDQSLQDALASVTRRLIIETDLLHKQQVQADGMWNEWTEEAFGLDSEREDVLYRTWREGSAATDLRRTKVEGLLERLDDILAQYRRVLDEWIRQTRPELKTGHVPVTDLLVAALEILFKNTGLNGIASIHRRGIHSVVVSMGAAWHEIVVQPDAPRVTCVHEPAAVVGYLLTAMARSGKSTKEFLGR